MEKLSLPYQEFNPRFYCCPSFALGLQRKNPKRCRYWKRCYIETISVVMGEKLLIRANFHDSKLVNVEIVQVKERRPDKTLPLMDGRTIPATFKQFTYGYANTSHAAQGKTVDRGILIMGEAAIKAGELRQGYVSNSRFEHSQAIYTTDLEAAKVAIGTEKERLLALDLMNRRKKVWKETAKRVRSKQRIRVSVPEPEPWS